MIITITVMIIVHLGVGRNDKGDHGNYNKEQGGGDKVSVFNSIYYVADPFLCKSLCSDWFFLDQDFTKRSNPCIFVLEQSRQISSSPLFIKCSL